MDILTADVLFVKPKVAVAFMLTALNFALWTSSLYNVVQGLRLDLAFVG